MTTAQTRSEPTDGGVAERGFTPMLWLALALGVVLRLVSLDDFPPPMLDEGGWPYSAREWAMYGRMTFDFHTTPGYHVVLGAVFDLFGATMLTARVFSAWLAVLSLALFWWVVRRISADATVAAWSTVLWATCFPAIDIGRRALIEPIQMVAILLVVAALSATRRRAAIVGGALATASLVLIKANAIVLLPAFALALWWDRSAALRTERLAKIGGMALGIALAGAVFLLLYRADPATFTAGWSPTLTKSFLASGAPVLRLGRFVIDPQLIQSGLDFIAAQTPFLFVLGLIGAARAVRDRDATIGGFWTLLLLPFLLLQVLQSPQYFSVLYPAFAIGSAALLVAAARATPGRLAWPVLALWVVVADGLGRSTAAMLFLGRPDRSTVTWLRDRIPAGERVMAAPFVLMQLAEPTVSMFRLPDPPFVPIPDRLREHDVRWIVIDEPEWRTRLARAGIDSAALADTLRPCCSLVHANGYAWIYRVNPTPPRPTP